jgi:hypothetical protein
MASSTLCFSGFPRDELAQVQKQFEQASAGLPDSWTLAPEGEARVLVIDMDSMYGHMTWLKARNGGQTTIGLTAGERSETDHTLKRPLSSDALRELLGRLSGASAATTPTAAAPEMPQASAAPTPSATATPGPSSAAVANGSLAAATAADGAAPVIPESLAPAPMAPAPAAPAPIAPAATAAPAPAPAPTPTPTPTPGNSNPSADYVAAITTGQMAAMGPTVPRVPRISDYLPKGVLGGPSKLQLPGAPELAFDPATQTYAGSATLKPLLPYVEASIREQDFTAIDAAEFERIKAASGGAHPYLRLLWLCGLAAGQGQLLPGYSSGRKFSLTKWPQIEREFPKHFRLATVMMKGPALVRDLAELSGVAEAEVLDFVNAGLVTGFVTVDGAAATPGDVARASAVLARPRGS